MSLAKLLIACVLTFGLVLAGILAAGHAAFASEPDKKDDQKKDEPNKDAPKKDGVAALWEDLASTDEAKASRALLALSARSKEATTYLKEQLKPVKVDQELIKKLIAQLDDDDFTIRQDAMKQLSIEVDHLGKFSRPILEQSMKGASLEVKKRIESVLEQLPPDPKEEGKDQPPPPVLKGKSISVSNIGGKITIMVDGKPLDLSALTKAAPPPRPNTQWLRMARAVAFLESLDPPGSEEHPFELQ